MDEIAIKQLEDKVKNLPESAMKDALIKEIDAKKKQFIKK